MEATPMRWVLALTAAGCGRLSRPVTSRISSRTTRIATLALPLAFAVGCGRVSFGYPVVACEEVVGTDSVLDATTAHCYSRHDGPSTYSEARAACIALGGHLVTIASPDELSAVVSVGLPDRSHIGLSNGSPGGTSYGWTTGEPLTFTQWANGQPTPPCTSVMTTVVTDAGGAWSSQCNYEGNAFVCEIEPWLVRDDGHAYRIWWGSGSWQSQAANCAAMGGHLATITSAEELLFVAQLTTMDVWLGATYSPTTGGAWITGEPFEFSAWDSAQPEGNGDQCVAMTSAEAWDDAPCATAFAALCERDE